jgi:hypothetical protein
LLSEKFNNIFFDYLMYKIKILGQQYIIMSDSVFVPKNSAKSNRQTSENFSVSSAVPQWAKVSNQSNNTEGKVILSEIKQLLNESRKLRAEVEPANPAVPANPSQDGGAKKKKAKKSKSKNEIDSDSENYGEILDGGAKKKKGSKGSKGSKGKKAKKSKHDAEYDSDNLKEILDGGAKKKKGSKGSKGSKGKKAKKSKYDAEYDSDNLKEILDGGAKKKKGSKGSKKSKGSKGSKGKKMKGGDGEKKREMPKFMKDLMEIKADVKADDTSIKDGPALSKVLSSYLKSTGDVQKAISMYKTEKKSGSFKKDYDAANKAIAAKRAQNKADKQAAKMARSTDSDSN